VNTENFEVEKIPIPSVPEMECDAGDEVIDASNITATYQGTTGKISITTGVCPSMLQLLQAAANNLAIYNHQNNENREISGGGYRSPESQWSLRQCFCHKEVEGVCNDDCFGCKNCANNGCNTASKLSCDGANSMHVKGLAVDVSFTDGLLTGAPLASGEKCGMVEKCNHPDLYTNSDFDKNGSESFWSSKVSDIEKIAIKAEQESIKNIMQGEGNSLYTKTELEGISLEFWHFEAIDKNKSCVSGIVHCPCTGDPLTCGGTTHVVCMLDHTGFKGSWKCSDSSKSSQVKSVVGLCGTDACTAKYTYDCNVE